METNKQAKFRIIIKDLFNRIPDPKKKGKFVTPSKTLTAYENGNKKNLDEFVAAIEKAIKTM